MNHEFFYFHYVSKPWWSGSQVLRGIVEPGSTKLPPWKQDPA